MIDRIRSAAHDAGAATGAVVTDLSDGAIDWVHTFDEDRVIDVTAPFVGGAVAAVSELRRRLTLRRVLIALGVAATAAIITAAIVRSVRRRDREESNPAPTYGTHRDAVVPDDRGEREGSDVRSAPVPESVTALRG
jgi:hypothetical protein